MASQQKKQLLIKAVLSLLLFLILVGRLMETIFALIALPFVSVKIKYFLIGSFFAGFILIVYQTYAVVKTLPSPRLIGTLNYPVSTKIFDRRGKLLYEIYREQNRTPVSLKNLPSTVIWATIAIEDKDFYQHNGISLFGGMMRAIKDSLLTRTLQGGSTITQQLVKSALLTPERTIQRKLKEIVLALWAERLFTKNQILEMYLNQVPYGGISYGIEEAAQTYFGKSAKELVLAETAFLAGLPQAPSLYSPYNNPLMAVKRRNEVLKKLQEQGYITVSAQRQAMSAPLIVKPPKALIRAPHFVFYVKSQLEETYGIKEVEEGGLRVVTSLDLEIQEEAEKILREELLRLRSLKIGNGAILVTAPQTGDILAMVGGQDYFATSSGAFNVTLAPRQPGSLIKPLMYSLALQKGYTAATILDDTPVSFFSPGAKPYRPVNYDGRYHGKMPLRYALANSYNVPAVKVLNTLGVLEFVKHAQTMGITTWTQPERFGLSLTLGGGEVRMIDVATAFSAFANEGKRVDVNPFLTIEDHRGNKIYQKSAVNQTSVVSSATAFIISDILADSFARRWAFGTGIGLDLPGFRVAVKTGTTNDKRDNWTVGYTPQILVGVWVGNNDNSPMNPHLTSGITGAAPIWRRMMEYLLHSGKEIDFSSNRQVRNFTMSDEIVQKVCYFGRIEYFIKGTENSVNCQGRLFSPSPTPRP